MNEFEMGRLVKGDRTSRVRERKVQTGAEIRAMRSLALQREGGLVGDSREPLEAGKGTEMDSPFCRSSTALLRL